MDNYKTNPKVNDVYLVFGRNNKPIKKQPTIVLRRNISIGIPLDPSIPTEMTSIESLVENENSSKTLKKLKIMLCYIFSD